MQKLNQQRTLAAIVRARAARSVRSSPDLPAGHCQAATSPRPSRCKTGGGPAAAPASSPSCSTLLANAGSASNASTSALGGPALVGRWNFLRKPSSERRPAAPNGPSTRRCRRRCRDLAILADERQIGRACWNHVGAVALGSGHELARRVRQHAGDAVRRREQRRDVRLEAEVREQFDEDLAAAAVGHLLRTWLPTRSGTGRSPTIRPVPSGCAA